MRAAVLLAALTLTAPLAIKAQWTIQTPATTADLRGIDNVGQGIVWASGTNGTVLRTEDAGYLWQVCTIPPQRTATSFGTKERFTATTPPHGYRSAVAYDSKTKTWITVGPNGTDISTDDGRNWRALKPGPQDPPDADQHWNALSLPFVVGPHGRIGILNPTALKPATP